MASAPASTEVTYDQASANLAKSGLAGKALSDAQANLKAHYDNAGAQSATGGDTGSTPSTGGSATGNSSDPFIAQLQKSLLDQSGMISSSDSNIEKSINDAIGSVKAGNDASKAQINSEYDRNRGYQEDSNANSEQSFFEARSGYATPTVAFANLREYNAKAIKDLDQRKNELLLQGDAAAAGKIADLQIQKLTFEQEAAQRTFTNLLGMGNFGLQVQAGNREQQQIDNQEKQAMSTIALKYGIQLNQGDTFESVVTRAMPMASKEEQLGLAKLSADIAQSQAQTRAANASAAASARDNQPLSPADLAVLANAYVKNPDAVGGLIKDPTNLAKVIGAAGSVMVSNAKDNIDLGRSQGVSASTAISNVNGDKTLGATEKASLITYINSTYPTKSSGGGFSTYHGAVDSVLGAGARAEIGLGNWLLGL